MHNKFDPYRYPLYPTTPLYKLCFYGPYLRLLLNDSQNNSEGFSWKLVSEGPVAPSAYFRRFQDNRLKIFHS